MKRSLVILAIFMALLNGCGGSGGDPPPALPEVKTGVFLDSAVQGLTYRTATQQGKTDSAGAFLYKDGEVVSFYIGDVFLGQTSAKPVVTPLDIAGESADVTHPRVAVICRLLQSLDADDDPENGIVLSDAVIHLVNTFIRNLETVTDLDQNADIANLFEAVNTAGVLGQNRALRSSEQALHHMRKTLAYAVRGISASGKPFDFKTAALSDQYKEYASPPLYAPSADDAEREIEEADIIRIEGAYLYILNAYRGLAVCDISQPDAPKIVSRLLLAGEPEEMFIRGNHAFILTSLHQYSDGAQTTRLSAVDLTSISQPVIFGTFDVKGYYHESRIVGGVLYVVSSQTPLFVIMPEPMTETDAAAPPVQNNTWASSFDISNPSSLRPVDEIQFGGAVSQIHVTESAIFTASYPQYSDASTITYADISDPGGRIIRRGSAEVTGNILDKHKIDFRDGYLRVCTYEWKNNGLSRLFMIDMRNPDAPKIASVLELGKGEQLFATRFDEDKAYLVTYEQKDPLWVVDLKNPEQPEIKGELIVPGWSTYIEPMGDRLIALGVDDTSGRRVAVSLFDVADPSNPALIKRISFGEEDGWSYSSAYSDVKAFTVLKDMGLILLPYTDYTNYLSSTENRLQLIDFSESDIRARGWTAQRGEVLRSRSVSNRLFSVSYDQLQVIDASDRDRPKVTAALTLADNIIDFIQLQNQYGVRTVQDPDGSVRLESVLLSDAEFGIPAGEIELKDADYSGSFGNGNLMYAVASAYMNNSRVISIQVTDFSAPSNPVRRGSLSIEGSVNFPTPFAPGMAFCPPYNRPKIFQMHDDVLAVVQTPYFYYGYESSDDPLSVTVADLKNPDAPIRASKITLTVDYPVSFLMKNRMLYFSYTDFAERYADGNIDVKYYLGRIDLTDYRNPKELKAINIPGICVGFDSAGGVAFTVNTRREKNGTVNIFSAVKLENDLAFLLSETTIQSIYNNMIIDGGYAYLSDYSYSGKKGYLNVIDLADPQQPIVYENELNIGWMSIVGAGRKKLFIDSGDGTGYYDAANPGKIRMLDFRSHSGYAYGVRFYENAAYLPLGYYGLWVK